MAKINGTSADDDLNGTADKDSINGRSGDDTIRGKGGNDSLAGDDFFGPFGDDTIFGEDGDDKLFGQGGDDELFGGKGDDYLEGRADDDRLAGNLGADELIGGEGADTFAFEKIQDSQSGRGNFDTINDFDAAVDFLEVSKIDANVGKDGNQTFNFKGEGDGVFTSAGQVEYSNSGSNTVVWLNNDGDAAADSLFVLSGKHDLQASDFVL